MIRDRVSISMDTYKTVLEKENLGEPHTTLVGGEMWYPPDEQRAREIRALNELAAQSLLSRNRASDDLVETMVIMQRAAVEYYTFANLEGRSVTVRTAAMGRDAVLILSDRKSIKLEPIPVEQLGVRLVAALPETPAARVHSMSCDNEDLRAVFKDKSLPTSNSARDAKRMKRLLEAERINTGQMYVAVRDGAGGRVSTRPPAPTWFDTEEGRILLSFDSSGWANLSGADLMTMSGKLEDMEKDLRR